MIRRKSLPVVVLVLGEYPSKFLGAHVRHLQQNPAFKVKKFIWLEDGDNSRKIGLLKNLPRVDVAVLCLSREGGEERARIISFLLERGAQVLVFGKVRTNFPDVTYWEKIRPSPTMLEKGISLLIEEEV